MRIITKKEERETESIKNRMNFSLKAIEQCLLY